MPELYFYLPACKNRKCRSSELWFKYTSLSCGTVCRYQGPASMRSCLENTQKSCQSAGKTGKNLTKPPICKKNLCQRYLNGRNRMMVDSWVWLCSSAILCTNASGPPENDVGDMPGPTLAYAQEIASLQGWSGADLKAKSLLSCPQTLTAQRLWSSAACPGEIGTGFA